MHPATGFLCEHECGSPAGDRARPVCRPEDDAAQADSDASSVAVGIVGFGSDFTLTLPHAAGAVTLTATAPDGSTSELSPCLTVGHKAPSFTATFWDPGCVVPSITIGAARRRHGAL
jgi:hypothetical protein